MIELLMYTHPCFSYIIPMNVKHSEQNNLFEVSPLLYESVFSILKSLSEVEKNVHVLDCTYILQVSQLQMCLSSKTTD